MTANPEYDRLSTTSGLGEVHTEDCVWVEAPEMQKEKKIEDPKQKGRPSSQGSDYRSSKFMVMIDHSKLSANTSEQTTSEGESQEANISCCVPTIASRKGFEKIVTGKVVSILPLLMFANFLAEDRRCSARGQVYTQR